MKIYNSKTDKSIVDWQWYEPSLRNITKLILDNLPNHKGKALDVGCGTGRVTIELAKRGFEVEGVDIEPRTIRIAKKIAEESKINCNFSVSDFTLQNNIRDNYYDLVVCSEVIEHISNYTQILSNIYCSLKKGGTFILTVPYDPKKFSELDTYGGHLRRFSYQQIKEDLKKFNILKYKITGFPFYRLIVRIYLLKLKVLKTSHSNENLWSKKSTLIISKILYQFCKIDNLFAFTRLGDALIVIAKK